MKMKHDRQTVHVNFIEFSSGWGPTGDLSDVGLLGYHDLRASKVGPGFMNLMTEMNKHTHSNCICP